MDNRVKAAAYIRVSTASRFQCHSYDFQVEALKRELEEMKGTELVAVYADKGISGRAAYNRRQFNVMMEDARRGDIDIIYCKSVARFARNTTELLTATRELRELGVAVYFESERINTIDTQSELYLIVAAAIAENELSIYKERNEWATIDNFKKGRMYYGNGVYGYKIDKENKTIVVDPISSEVVKWVFNEYTKGKSADKIAKELNEAGIKTQRGNTWKGSSILAMLENEKYYGDCLLQKTYTEKGTKKKNKGERDAYLLEGSHEGIIRKELYDEVQRIKNSKPNHILKDREPVWYPFTGLIECGCCGRSYIHKVNNAGTKYASDIWACSRAVKEGKASCQRSTSIKDETLRGLFVEVYNQFVTSGEMRKGSRESSERKRKLLADERELRRLITKGLITHENYAEEMKGILDEIKELDKISAKKKQQSIKASECNKIEGFEEEKLERFIQKITIENYLVTFVFVNGVEITRRYNKGNHGDIRNWIEQHGHPSTLRKEERLRNGNGTK